MVAARHGDDSGRESVRDEVKQGVERVPSSEPMTEKEEEEEEDRIDIAETERRLADPDEVPIPYEQARRSLGLG
jgi:hypothetical protein